LIVLTIDEARTQLDQQMLGDLCDRQLGDHLYQAPSAGPLASQPLDIIDVIRKQAAHQPAT
jgi:hypothetical protein